ncbi:MAG: translation elongation factor 4 [Candidatus Paceibacterota bacterium]|nr:MAG: translation elongation factor 4 [Candidatus Paceibacterota bacterium]
MHDLIRNFVIIAHIDHGKSTLADRFLELTGAVERRKMQNQYLDQMDLERERGITIKLQPVRMRYTPKGAQQPYTLNLIDTPGHVDFSYEVSRSLAAVEGAILLVDATKGIQAQTLANLHLAQRQGLVIVPAINKVDLPNARTEIVKEQLSLLLGITPETILSISAKQGTGVAELLDRVVRDVPPPRHVDGPTRALIFDSSFDAYKGVIAYVRMVSGAIGNRDTVLAWATKARAEVLETGWFAPQQTPEKSLEPGMIGYIATGIKDPGQIHVGDTITLQREAQNTAFEPLPGYRQATPMVFASFFPENGEEYDVLKDALGKLKLTDASLVYEPESSAGLGRGFRVGFLGMLHVEIISERLRREFQLKLIVSSPSVEYQVTLKNGEELLIRSAALLPDPSHVTMIAEPIARVEIITPSTYVGGVMELAATRRSVYEATEYLGSDTAVLRYTIPLAELITDFYDQLKSVSSGYASLSYELSGFRIDDLVRLDILVADDLVEPFSRIVPRSLAYREGRAMVEKLKDIIPAQWFAVALQAVIGGKVIARETIKARRKDVTGYLYGGDVTRKMKLLEKQKRGKKKMEELGKVEIPHSVFLDMLKR